jgi:hypothetical protein
MAYIGSTPTSQSFTPGTDYFSGNGSTVAFTLTRPAVSINDLIVVIENVVQKPLDAYTVVGTTLTFTSAPPSGTNNIYVRYMSVNTLSVAPNDLSVTTEKIADNVVTVAKLHTTVMQPANISDKANISTGYLALPSGTTAQRPASPVNGMLRYNTTLSKFEIYQNSEWINYSLTYAGEYLIVAGGGSGARAPNVGGGGGGAGGAIDSTISFVSGSIYSIVIGAGGAAYSATDGGGNNGSNSTGFGNTCIGGGTGSYYSPGTGYQSATSGGSGGGAGWNTLTGASGTSGQGFAGGSLTFSGAQNNLPAAGGGGKTSVGTSVNGTATNVGSAGGAGINWKSLGTYYAGGGGGGGAGGGGAGGLGGGGNGGSGASGAATTGGSGTVNTGGGGGGTGETQYNTFPSYPSGAGGSGVVIVRYIGSQKGTGGTITSSGGYTYHTFTSSGTYTA